jgi:hypothetical protein
MLPQAMRAVPGDYRVDPKKWVRKRLLPTGYVISASQLTPVHADVDA